MDNNSEGELSGEFILNKEKKGKAQIPPDNSIVEEGVEVTENLPKNKANFLSSLCYYPKNVHFENQEKDEVIILLVRRSLVTNIPWIIFAIVLMTLPLFFFLISDFISPFISISLKTVFVTLLFYYLMIFGLIIIEFMLWYFNVGLVTNKRIVDLDLHGVLYKFVSETRLNLVEDVSYSKIGSVRAVFDYGDVFIQTAGAMSNFEFDRAPQPAKIVRIIADMIGGKAKKWK